VGLRRQRSRNTDGGDPHLSRRIFTADTNAMDPFVGCAWRRQMYAPLARPALSRRMSLCPASCTSSSNPRTSHPSRSYTFMVTLLSTGSSL
jgi:hypothetical protein